LSFKNIKIKWHFKNKTFDEFVRALWVFCGVLSIVLFLQIDRIVHQDLYNYGLKFSYDWANTYWMAFRLALAFMLIPVILSGFQLTFDLMTWLKARKEDINEETKQPIPAKKAKKRKMKRVHKPRNSKKHEKRVEEQNLGRGTLMECSNCGKTFTKPLIMLDFSGDEAKLISMCPYCNAQLDNNQETEEVHCYVKEYEEKTVEKT